MERLVNSIYYNAYLNSAEFAVQCIRDSRCSLFHHVNLNSAGYTELFLCIRDSKGSLFHYIRNAKCSLFHSINLNVSEFTKLVLCIRYSHTVRYFITLETQNVRYFNTVETQLIAISLHFVLQ